MNMYRVVIQNRERILQNSVLMYNITVGHIASTVANILKAGTHEGYFTIDIINTEEGVKERYTLDLDKNSLVYQGEVE